MSDQADRETMGDGLGVYSVDAEDQLQPEDTLDGSGDVLDRGFRVGDTYRGSTAYGVTADEQAAEETIDQRIRQEEADPWSAYGAPDNESGLDRPEEDMLGGEDEDAVPAGRDYYGGEGGRIGRLVAPDEGLFPDREARLVAREGRATSWDSPEESAMHYIDGDEEDELTEVEWDPSDEPLRDADE